MAEEVIDLIAADGVRYPLLCMHWINSCLHISSVSFSELYPHCAKVSADMGVSMREPGLLRRARRRNDRLAVLLPGAHPVRVSSTS